MKHIFVTLTLMISSSYSLYGGNIWSRQKPVQQQSKITPVEQVKQEINSYLQTINMASITSRTELEERLQIIFNNEAQDPNKFPLFNAFIKQDTFQQNEELQEEFGAAIRITVENFIDKKSTELGLLK